MDTDAPLVWFVMTDENANKVTVSGFKIEPYVPEPEPNVKELLERIDKLEEMIAHGQSDAGTASTQQSKQSYGNNRRN